MITKIYFGQSYKKQIILFFFSAYFLVGLIAYDDYGISTDEPVSRTTGIISLLYITDILVPGYSVQDPWLKKYQYLPELHSYKDKDYGIVFELPSAMLEKAIGLEDSKSIFLFRHLLTFFVSYAGAIAFFSLAKRRFSDWRIALLGTFFLILSPRIFAESFYNDKDIVFMSLFIIAMNFAVRFIVDPSLKNALWSAITTGLLIDVRLMGVILPPLIAAILIQNSIQDRSKYTHRVALILFYLVGTVFFVIIFWPYLWSNPWDNFAQAFHNMAKFRWNSHVLYFGEFIRATNLPWHYIPVWLVITTPVFYLIFFNIGLFTSGISILRFFKLKMAQHDSQDVFFLALFFGPVLAVIVLESVLYDGWRQMYFIYPAFLLIALKGWTSIAYNEKLAKLLPWSRIFLFATLLALSYTAYWMINNHPYQYVYFNRIAGNNLKERFERDYWGLSARQALENLATFDHRKNIKIWPGSWINLDIGIKMLRQKDRMRFKTVHNECLADYVITQYRHNLTDFHSAPRYYKKIHEINVDNEPVISTYLINKPFIVREQLGLCN